jgi:hypothetical protein
MAKSFIIALEGPTLTWSLGTPGYRHCPLIPGKGFATSSCSTSKGTDLTQTPWPSYLSANSKRRKPLHEYYRNFLTLKLQLPLVDDHIAIHYAINGLRVGVLYSHCIRDPPKNLQVLYRLFEKYARSEELHQRKVESQRKPKDPPQPSRTWTRPAQPDSGLDNHNHHQVHNIVNQQPAGETTRHQEYHPQGRGNGTKGRGRGRTQQPRRFYYSFHGEDCAHPTRDCPETKATRHRMSRAQSADNQRVVAHKYHQQQPYLNEQIQHPPNHAQQHQEVQVLPLPPPHHQNPPHHHHPQAPKQEDFVEPPYQGVIHMITGGS